MPPSDTPAELLSDEELAEIRQDSEIGLRNCEPKFDDDLKRFELNRLRLLDEHARLKARDESADGLLARAVRYLRTPALVGEIREHLSTTPEPVTDLAEQSIRELAEQIEGLREENARLRAQSKPPDYGVGHKLLCDWVNALPEPFRAYVYRLETDADPSSNIRDAVCWKENAMAMAEENARLKATVAQQETELDAKHATLVETADKLRITRVCSTAQKELADALTVRVTELEKAFRQIFGPSPNASTTETKRCDQCDPSFGCFDGRYPCSKRVAGQIRQGAKR